MCRVRILKRGDLGLKGRKIEEASWAPEVQGQVGSRGCVGVYGAYITTAMRFQCLSRKWKT